jgi:dihydrofolate reductase
MAKRKVKLQMQFSVDGFVAGPNGEMDWMAWNWDEELKNYVTELTDSSDTCLVGRVLYHGMGAHWRAVPEGDENYPYAQILNNFRKVVFSRTSPALDWNNSELAKGTLAEEVARVKALPGKDIITYGGAGLASDLVKQNLIDEYHLFINPAAIGSGLSIWKNLEGRMNLELVHSKSFTCGIVVLCYRPK